MSIKDITPWNWLKKQDEQQSSPTYHPLARLQQEVDQIFSNFFHSFDDILPTEGRSSLGLSYVPKLDISEDKDKYLISMEVPGVEKEDISIKVTEDNNLVVSGEKKFSDEHKAEDYHTIERSYGKFSRTISLPSNCKYDSIGAKFKNGVLEVKIDKDLKAQEKVKNIEIK